MSPALEGKFLTTGSPEKSPGILKLRYIHLKKIVIYLRLAALGLFAARGLALVAASRLLNAVASLVAEHGL